MIYIRENGPLEFFLKSNQMKIFYDCRKEKPILENIYFNILLLRKPFCFKIVHVLILPSLFKCPSSTVPFVLVLYPAKNFVVEFDR